MKIKSLFLIFSVLFLFISSCDNNLVISESKTLESGTWNIDETIKYTADINLIDIFYNFFVEVDIHDDFLTNNLWLFIETQSPSGNIQSDTMMYYVADEKGKWFGDKNGEIIKNRFLYKSNIRFSEAGTYKFSLQHGMRKNDLPKVLKVGIRIEEIIPASKED